MDEWVVVLDDDGVKITIQHPVTHGSGYVTLRDLVIAMLDLHKTADLVSANTVTTIGED